MSTKVAEDDRISALVELNLVGEAHIHPGQACVPAHACDKGGREDSPLQGGGVPEGPPVRGLGRLKGHDQVRRPQAGAGREKGHSRQSAWRGVSSH